MAKLTERQRKFADYYIELDCTEQAAIKAGYSVNYAKAQSYKLLVNVGIKSYIDERLEKLESECIASAAEVMKYLTSILRGEQTEKIVVVEGCGDGMSEARKIDKLISAKDKLKAAELLGKHPRKIS